VYGPALGGFDKASTKPAAVNAVTKVVKPNALAVLGISTNGAVGASVGAFVGSFVGGTGAGVGGTGAGVGGTGTGVGRRVCFLLPFDLLPFDREEGDVLPYFVRRCL